MDSDSIHPARETNGHAERPRIVALAVQLALVGLLLNAVGRSITHFGNPIPQSLVAGLIAILGTVAVFAWLYWRLYVGRSWARYVVLALSVPGWLMFLNPVYQARLLHSPLFAQIATAVDTLSTLFLLWAVFLSSGRPWFDRH